MLLRGSPKRNPGKASISMPTENAIAPSPLGAIFVSTCVHIPSLPDFQVNLMLAGLAKHLFSFVSRVTSCRISSCRTSQIHVTDVEAWAGVPSSWCECGPSRTTELASLVT